MSDERLNRRKLIGVAGGALAASSAGGLLGSEALAARPLSENLEIGTVTSVHGSVAEAVSEAGRHARGTVQSVHGLQPGDRVVIVREADGSEAVTPLFVDVVGTVDAVDGRSIVVDGTRYAIDRASTTKKVENGRWVNVGAVADNFARGATIQAVGITNSRTGTTTVAAAWV
jgi:hypothetical protein